MALLPVSASLDFEPRSFEIGAPVSNREPPVVIGVLNSNLPMQTARAISSAPLAGVAAQPSVSAGNLSDWPTFFHDVARTGYRSQPLEPPLRWHRTYELGGTGIVPPGISPPVIANGTLFSGASKWTSQGRNLEISAVDLATGSQIWNYSVVNTDMQGTPVLTFDEGVLYFTTVEPISNPGYSMFALDGRTGSLLWRRDAVGASRPSVGWSPSFHSVAASNGSAYFEGEYDATVRKFDGRTGSEIWVIKVPEPPIEPWMVPVGWANQRPENATNLYSPAFSGRMLYVYGEHHFAAPASSGGWNLYVVGAVHAINATNGSLEWSRPTSTFYAPGSTHLVATNGTVYASRYVFHSASPWTIDLSFLAIDGFTGTILWEYSIVSRGDDADTGYFATGAGTVFIPYYRYRRELGKSEGFLVALNASTGVRAWEVALGFGNFPRYLAVASNIVYLAGGVLAALNITTREVVWSRTPGFAGVPALAGDILYVATSSSVVAFTPGDNPLRISWIPKSPMPTARNNLFRGRAALRGEIYAVGGWTGNFTNAVEIYNVTTNSWKAGTPLPEARADGAIQVLNDKLYALGGDGPGGGGGTSTVWEYDSVSNVWRPQAPMPTGRRSLASAVLGGKIYAISGVEGGVSAAVEVYDPYTDTWTSRSPHPLPRQYLTAQAVRGKIYTFGGNQYYEKVHEYDPVSDVWIEKSPVPFPTQVPSSVAVGGKIFLVGGAGSRTVLMYDPLTDTWMGPLDDLRTARAEALTSEVNGRIYAIGGCCPYFYENATEEGLIQPPLDAQPPSTAVSLSGMLGQNTWYVSSVDVNLTASDTSSGVASVSFRINAGGWQDYRGPFTIDVDGLSTLEFFATDNSGNEEPIRRVVVKIDRIEPLTGITLDGAPGANGWYRSAVNVTLTASDPASGVASTFYRIDNGPWLSYNNPVNVGEGRHMLDYYSVDVAGLGEVARSISLNVDATAPRTVESVSGRSGQNGWFISNVSVGLNASDPLSGLSQVYYRVDGGTWQVYSSPFNVTGDGVHAVEFYATDLAGNAEVPRILGINIDTIPPRTSISVGGIAGAGNWYVSGVTLALVVSESTSGLGQVSYRVDAGSWQTYVGPFEIAADGIHAIEVKSVDIAGNSELQLLDVSIDATAPSASVTLGGVIGNNGWYRSPVNARVTGVDPTSGVLSISYRIDSGPWQPYFGALEFLDGQHVLEYRIVDFAGNTRTTQPLQIKVDRRAPFFGILNPAGLVRASEVTIAWAGSDEGSGIDHFEISVDNRAFLSVGARTTITLSLPDGDHIIRLRAIDAAGNSAQTELSLQIDTNVFSVTGPYFGAPLYAVAAIAAIASFFLWRRLRARLRPPTQKG